MFVLCLGVYVWTLCNIPTWFYDAALLQGWGIVEFAKSEDAATAIEQLDRSEVILQMLSIVCNTYIMSGLLFPMIGSCI